MRREQDKTEFPGILAGGLLYQSASSMQSTIASPFFSNRGFSPSQIGFLNSVSWSIVGFASMPFGRLSDIIGRRTPMILSALLASVGCLLVYLSTNIFTAVSLYVLIGLSTAFFTPIVSAVIFEASEPSRAPVFFAMFYLVTLIGSSLSSFLAGWISKSFVAELPFLLASLLFLITILSYSFNLRDQEGKTGKNLKTALCLFDLRSIFHTLKQYSYLGFYGFSLFFHELGFFMISPYVTLYVQKVLGLDTAEIGMVVAMWNIGSAVGFLPWAWVTKRRGSGKMLLAHLLVSSPAWASLALSDSFGSMLLCIFIFGIVGAMDLPARRTLTAELSRGEKLGEAMGFVELSNGLSGMMGGALGGFLWETLGPSSIFYTAGVLTLISTLFLFIVIKNMH
ncbi:MAG: MFS transporter [Thermoproteota archaeon]